MAKETLMSFTVYTHIVIMASHITWHTQVQARTHAHAHTHTQNYNQVKKILFI